MVKLMRCNAAFIRRRGTAMLMNGYTLLELVIIVAILGILTATLVPSWLMFINTWQLNTAQETVYMAIRDAQSNARRNHATWQASFRELNGILQWAIHPANMDPTTFIWQSFDSKIRLDPETTLLFSNGVYRVRFDEDGNVSGQLGRLTLASKAGGRVKRCIMVSTLIGAIRRGSNQPAMQDGKYCY